MTLRFKCRGRCQDPVERTGKWEKVGDVVSPAQCKAHGVCCGATLGSFCQMFVFDLWWDIRTRWHGQLLSEQDAMW